MIAFLRGQLAAKGEGFALVDVGGVGYRLNMSAISLSRLPKEGSQCTLHTHLQVREDDMSLFGFATLDEKQLFELLVSVSGVGPKLALAVLSSLTPGELRDAVARDDLAMISSVPGVGRKTAQRLFVDLKDRIGVPEDMAPSRSVTADTAAEAREALEAMGFSRAEVSVAMRGYEGPNEAEALVVHGLRRLGGTP